MTRSSGTQPPAPPLRSVLDVLRAPARLEVLRATGLLDAEPDAALERLTRVAARALGVPIAQVSLVDDALQFVCAATGLTDSVADRESPLSHSFCKHVVADGVALVVSDAREHPLVHDNLAVSERGVLAYLGVPVVVDGHVLGALCGVDHRPREWSEDDLAQMEDLGQAVSDALALRARRVDELVVEALERSVLASLPDTGIMQLDRELRVILAEGMGFRGEGWAPETFVGRNLVDVLPADSYAQLAPCYRAALAGESVSFDTVDPTTGRVWWVQAAPVRGEGDAIRAASVVIRDVTVARTRERDLAEREAQFRLLADNSSDVISRHATDGRFLYASPAAQVVFGHLPAGLVGRPMCDLVHPDDRAGLTSDLAALLHTGRSVTSSYRLLRPGGDVAWMESTTTAVIDAGAVRELHCATRDVTGRRAAEDARRASEALYATLFGALEEGVLVYDAENRIVALNPSAERMLGALAAPSAERMLGALAAPSAERMLGALAAPIDDLESARQSWLVSDEQGRRLPVAERPSARVLATGEPQLGVVVALDAPDDARRWLRVNAVPLRAGDGSIERVLSSWADITELREAEDRARHQADHDPLTGLPNRALLARRLGDALAAARGARHDLGVLFFDLDAFKVVNDSLGHHGGDELLRAVANRLSGALRAGGETLARFAGDEFVVLAPDVEGSEGASALADRLLAVIREPLHVAGTDHVVHASAGVVVAPGGQGDAEDLLRDADVAMYEVKKAGGRGRKVFEPEMYRQAVQRLSTESALRLAIANDELELHYQPIWTLPGGDLSRFEALVRWRHPVRGLVSPGEFVPVAEQSGLIVDLGEWVLRAACAQLRDWGAEHGSARRAVNVNVSTRQLADPTLLERLADLLDEHGLPASCLGLEVTESMLMEEHGHATETLAGIHALGVHLSLDDFGTGYSSLSRLKDLPLEVLKIDRSFVSGPAAGTRQHAILGSIISMAHSIDLEVVAEGVETEEQLALLREYGCDFAQGFLLAPPAPAADVAPLLRHPGRAPA